jgi:hypothetical protein
MGVDLRDLAWKTRKATWSRLWATAVRPRLAPRRVPVPRDEPKIRLISAPESYRDFNAPSLIVPASVPAAEASALTNNLVRVYHGLQEHYPIITRGQARASPDRRERAREAFSHLYRPAVEPPRWHENLVAAEASGNLLGALALAGPFAKLLRRAEGGNGRYEIDLDHLSAYPVRPGLRRLGCRIHFLPDRSEGLRVTSVEYGGQTIVPPDGRWKLAEEIALTSLLTHLTVWRHGMQYHVGGVAPIAPLLHNLPAAHPLRRLMAPHIDQTISTNYHTHVTLRRGGFDVTGFSFSYDTILRYYDDGVKAFDIAALDPRVSAARRGIAEDLGGDYLQQALRYYDVFREYVDAYLRHYYRDDSAVGGDDALRQWFDQVDAYVPNGIRQYVPALTLESLIALCTLFIYSVTVEHEENTLWHYAPFLPPTVHEDGSGPTVGEVQAVMNFQFVISSARNRLMGDHAHVALDPAGADIMRRFQARLVELQAQIERVPDRHWRILPRDLEASVSA